jgi:hypothetical protein
MKYFFLLIVFFLFVESNAQSRWKGNTTPTYHELISELKRIDIQHKDISLFNMGISDYGLPLYLLIVNAEKDSLKTFQKAREKSCLLVNNAIHPGEPDGVNAMLIWLEEWIEAGKPKDDLPVVAFIPAYNIGGMLNRSTNSRANQNGPEEYGFRGNARNLDLNRDFVKMDSENSFIFSKIFHALNPDVFIDNHVSNGADYSYTLTCISSVQQRIDPYLSQFEQKEFQPYMTQQLKSKDWTLYPYVELKSDTPDKGIIAFNDLPRYSMGYTSLFNTLSFTVETHMLKPFPQRVIATKDFMESVIEFLKVKGNQLELVRRHADQSTTYLKWFKYNYKLSGQSDSIDFKGYQHSRPIHPVTGLPRLFYDSSQPINIKIAHYNHYFAQDSVLIPRYYIVGFQERETRSRLKANEVKYFEVQKDTLMMVTTTIISDFKSTARPYEGHFRHSDIQLKKQDRLILIKKGDWIIPTEQRGNNYLNSVLQPRAEDSFFSWNFYDSYLQQKEYFSNYVFIDLADEILKNDPQLNANFQFKKQNDKSFRDSEWEQLYYIYVNSPYFEQTFNRLPIYEYNGVWKK